MSKIVRGPEASMSKKPAPKKKRPIVSAVNIRARGATAKSIRRVVSYALASGMRNVLRFDVQTHFKGFGRPYREVNITFIDTNMKAKW